MANPYDRLTLIARPPQVMGRRTIQAYRDAQFEQMSKLTAIRSMPGIDLPRDADDGAVAWVGGGKWLLTCVCGNYPSASPEWDIALCFSCGLVYNHITWPVDIVDIEKALCTRPTQYRTWTDETVADLKAWNLDHGYEETL